MFHDPAGLKLGRKPASFDSRTLKLTTYAPSLPPAPLMKNWGTVESDWGMMVNDKLGDCTIASAGHIVLMDTAARGNAVIIPDSEIVKAYSAVSGYDPVSGANDDGAVELRVLNYWRQTGIGGHKILAYVSIPPRNTALLRQAIYLFGSVYAGVNLPISAQNQGIWRPTGVGEGDSAPGSWGGHAVPLVGYDTASFACVTWGDVKWLTEPWWNLYGDEAYAVISEDWSAPAGLAPNSFNLDQLKADLAAITKESANGTQQPAV